MMFNSIRRQRAVTLTELLVVLAIISLLATLAVPVYVSQINRARVATAQAEVRSIAEAQQAVAVTHGYFVPIHILNNVPNAPTGASSTGDRDDFVRVSSNTVFAIDATISPDRYRNGDVSDANYNPRIQTSGSNSRITRMVETWQGPFLNPKRIRYDGASAGVQGSGDYSRDLVVDPWGNPYRFYFTGGLIGDGSLPTGPLTDSQVNLAVDNGNVTPSGAEQGRFDRFAILSYGPDSVSGYASNNSLISGDDVFYTFTSLAVGNETTYQGF
jgi:prepilin-type N-terminal cleavage/methylation domain-containing protein